MIKTLTQDVITIKLINAALQSTEASSSPPFQCLLQYPESKIILQSFCSLLEKTRDPAVKIRVYRLFLDFSIQKAPDLNSVGDEIILNSILSVFVSAPPLCSQKDCEILAKFIKEMLKLIKTIKITTIFNNFIKSNSLFSPLGIVILTKDQPQLHPNTIKFIIAMVHNNLEILNVAACALFFSQNKYSSLTEAAKNEFNSENASEILQQTILNSMTQKINFRLAAIELAHSLFHFYSPCESNQLLKAVMTVFTQQFKESSVQLRTNIVICLSDFPEIEDDKKFLTTMLPFIASRFNECDECDDDFAVAVFAFIRHFSSSVFMRQVVLDMIKSHDNYVSGVILGAFLGYLKSDSSFRKTCLLPTPMTSQKAIAAVMAVTTMVIYKLFDKETFVDSFESILTVLTTSELLDDFFVQFRVFKAADMLAAVSGQYPYEVSRLLFKYLGNLKGDDVISHVSPIVETIKDSEEIQRLNSGEFAQVFVSLMTKYIDDPSVRPILLPFLYLISPNKSKSEANVDMMLCDLFDVLVPSSFVDAIRTEAILKSQSAPRASLIAVSLPKCEPFFPTLSRVVRELYPEDTDLTLQFLENASKRSLEAFIPHLLRFAEPVKISNSYFLQFVSIKTKKTLHLNAIFKSLSFITHELKPNASLLSSLLQVAEAAFPKEEKMDSVCEDALKAFIELSKIESSEKWPVSLLKKIFGYHYFAPSFYLLLPHCPADIELIKLAADSYASYISKTGENMNNLFSSACIKCHENSSSLGAILNASFKYIESSKDQSIMLDLCLVSTRCYREKKDDVPTDIFDCILSLSKFVLSSADSLRNISKDIFVSLYSLKLPVESKNNSVGEKENLTPFRVIDYSAELFTLIYEKFSVNDTIDFAIFTLNSRPFTFCNALVLNTLTEQQAQSLVSTTKNFLSLFFDISNKTKKKVRSVMQSISYRLGKTDMQTYLKCLVLQPMTPFISDTISHFIQNEEFRSTFFANFTKIAMESSLPIAASEQMTFLSTNFMQSIPVIIHADECIEESFSKHATYLTIWLSNIAGANQNLKLQNNIKEMSNSFNELFQKVAKSDIEPIEFQMNTVQSLYQSFGTLISALLLTDDKMIITFCESLFALLKVQNQKVVFIASLCISRLFTRLVQYADQILIEKLKKSVAMSFTVCCDENCRFLSAVMNDIFNRPLFESFSEEEATSILNGTIRGVAYPGPNLKNESLAFLCKITIVFGKSIISPQLERLWEIMNDQEFSPLVLTTMNSLLQIDNTAKHISGKITLDGLIIASVGESNAIAKNSKTVLETLTGMNAIEDILKRLKEMIEKVEFDEICERIINKINRNNVSDNVVDLLIKLNALEDKDTKYQDKVISLLLTIMEDNNNPLKQTASQHLVNLFSE